MKQGTGHCAKVRTGGALVAAMGALLLLSASACNSGTHFQARAQDHDGSTREADPGINLNCILEHIQNPTESFHYEYRKDASDHLDERADITPQTIDGSFTDSGFRRKFHGVHSDPRNWKSAWSGLLGIRGMSSAIFIVNHHTSTVREPGSNLVNGYQAIHYSIDTSRFNATERQILGPTLGLGGFERGDAWVNEHGCPVTLSLDSELHRSDGSLLEKIHYEEEIVRK